jgi:hypothetical protein
MNPPKTKEEWCLWGARASCLLGCEVLSGEKDPPEHYSRERFALEHLLKAVGEIAEYLALKEKTLDTPPK